MAGKILAETKHVLGLGADYEVFDQDVLMHANTAFATLCQLGIGPENGFEIDASTEWPAYTEDLRLNGVKTYLYLRVRILFDPPQTSYAIEAMERQIRELEWRLNVVREGDIWVDPDFMNAFMWLLEADNQFPPEAEIGDLGYVPGTHKIWRKIND